VLKSRGRKWHACRHSCTWFRPDIQAVPVYDLRGHQSMEREGESLPWPVLLRYSDLQCIGSGRSVGSVGRRVMRCREVERDHDDRAKAKPALAALHGRIPAQRSERRVFRLLLRSCHCQKEKGRLASACTLHSRTCTLEQRAYMQQPAFRLPCTHARRPRRDSTRRARGFVQQEGFDGSYASADHASTTAIDRYVAAKKISLSLSPAQPSSS
jgi:hypothetical protein